jgi:hypothetical protein
MGDLLGEDFSIAAKDTLYRCLDRLVEHKEALFGFLRGRWSDLLDVHFPTTDGRTLIFCRYTMPNKTQKLLLAQLGLELPPQSPPRITSNRSLEPLPAKPL